MHDVVDDGRTVHEREIEAREVKRDRHERLAGLQELPLVRADVLDDVGVEAVDEARFLECGDEIGRRQAAERRRLPARERFEAAELARERAHDGLVENLDVAFFERLVEMLAHVALHGELAAHLRHVDGVDARRVALDAFAGELRFLEGIRCVFVFARVFEQADTGFELDVRVADVCPDERARALDGLLHVLDAREHGEVVSGEVRDEAAGEEAAQDFRDVPEARVALADAVRRVVQAEVRDVEIHGAELRERAVFCATLRLLVDAMEERVHAHELRDLVGLDGLATAAHVRENQAVERAERRVQDLLHIALGARDVMARRLAAERQIALVVRALARKRFERLVVLLDHEAAEMASRVLEERGTVAASIERKRGAVREQEVFRAVGAEEADGVRQEVVRCRKCRDEVFAHTDSSSGMLLKNPVPRRRSDRPSASAGRASS